MSRQLPCLDPPMVTEVISNFHLKLYVCTYVLKGARARTHMHARMRTNHSPERVPW